MVEAQGNKFGQNGRFYTENVMTFGLPTGVDVIARSAQDLVAHNIWVHPDAVAKMWGAEAAEQYKAGYAARQQPQSQ